MGRPRSKGIQLRVWLPPDIEAEVRKLAQLHDLTQARVIVQLLRFAQPLFDPLVTFAKAAQEGDVDAMQAACDGLSFDHRMLLRARREAAQRVTGKGKVAA